MSPTINSSFFIRTFINTSPNVKPSRLDKTIKGIITKYRRNTIESLDAPFLVEYLNKLRIIYFLKRLDYFNKPKALRLRGTYSYPSLFLTYTNNILGLIDATFKAKKTLDLDYLKDILEASNDPLISEEISFLNIYILKYSLIFKDLSKYLKAYSANSLLTSRLGLVKSFYSKGLFSSDIIGSYKEELTIKTSNKSILELDYYFLGSYNYLNPRYTSSIRALLNNKDEDPEALISRIEELGIL